MASNGAIKGITIKIEGDTNGLAKDLQSVNKDIAKTNAALKDVEKALKLDPGNVELLAQKQELLNKQIQQTEQKLKLEQQAAEKAKKALDIGKISQEEYAQLQSEVVKTQHSLDNLQTEADQTKSSLEGAGSGASSAADGIGDIGFSAESILPSLSEVGISISGWGDVAKLAVEAIKTNIKIAIEAIKAFVTAIKKTIEGVMTALAKMAEVAKDITKKFLELAEETADLTDEIDKNSAAVGMDYKSYQKWDYILKQNGSSMSENASSFKKLTDNIAKARDGNKKAIEKFKELGISIKDVQTLSREEIFEKVILGLQNVSDETTKASLANDLLGKSSQGLSALLNQTNEDVNSLADQAERYGLILSDDLVQAGVEYGDSLQLLQDVLTTTKAKLIGGFLPGLTKVATGIAGLVAGVEGADKDIEEGLNEIVDNFNKVAPALIQAINDALPTLIPLAGEIISTLVTGIIDNLPALVEAAVQVINTFIAGITAPENVDKVGESVALLMEALCNGFLAILDVLIDPILQIIEKIVDTLLLPENFEKLLNTGLKVFIKFIEGISQAIPKILPVLEEAIITIKTELEKPENKERLKEAASLLWGAFCATVIDVVNQLWNWILGWFTDAITGTKAKAMKWGADMLQGFIDGLKSMWSKFTGWLEKCGKAISDFLGFSVPKKGPLHEWKWNNPGADMIKLFDEGIQTALPQLQQTVTNTANLLKDTTPNYSGQLNGISAQLSNLGGSNNGTYVINVQVGSTNLAQAVLSAQQMEALRSGGI